MQFETFQQTLKEDVPPADATVQLTAMWYDARDNWNKAHSMVDNLNDSTSCWVHAYLHRKEGDTGNADYWYRKAGKKRPESTLQEEWKIIVQALL